MSPLGRSDHNNIYLVPKYRQLIKREKATVKKIRSFDDSTVEKLQRCLANTDWSVFIEHCKDIDELTETISNYITFCENICVETKEIKIYPNNKPWITRDLCEMTKAKRDWIKSGDREEIKCKQNELQLEIDRCKTLYRDKMKSLFSSQNSRQAWQGLQKASGYYKERPKINISNTKDFVEELNVFYSRFDTADYQQEHQTLRDTLSECEKTIFLTVDQVRNMFKSLVKRKATGPDNVSAFILRSCADELCSIYHHIYEQSVKEHRIPVLWKTSAVVPVPKKAKPSEINDYRPVALTPIAMKCLEKLMLSHLLDYTKEHLDDHQFAYRKGRSLEDAILTLLNSLYKHLDNTNVYARSLFIYFSSAFNTIQPHLMVDKPLRLHVPPDLCLWVLDFLTNGRQFVKLDDVQSSLRTLSTGAPQCCVISPVLFIIYTNDLYIDSTNNIILKYADDTVIVGLITDCDELLYRQEIVKVKTWC